MCSLYLIHVLLVSDQDVQELRTFVRLPKNAKGDNVITAENGDKMKIYESFRQRLLILGQHCVD